MKVNWRTMQAPVTALSAKPSAAQKNNLISVCPNPARDFIFITDIYKESQYRITDLRGQIILEGVIKELASYIDITGIQKGIYLIGITSQEGTVTNLIVKE